MKATFPAKNSNPTQENVRQLDEALTSLIAGHPGSVKPWTFYEEIDAYLGPWGDTGYPIGYGKFYCKLFTENPKLARDPAAAHWVKLTTVALQEALKSFILTRYRSGTLSSVTEAELRDAAFASHAVAYSDSGLATVALVAPELIGVILTIPRKEFSPFSQSFEATIAETVETMGRVLPSAVGISIAAAMPAHSGLLRNAALRDRMETMREGSLIQWLTDTEKLLRLGRLDRISALNQITSRLNATQFGDQGLAARARQIVELADTRKRATAAYYRKLLMEHPKLRQAIDRADPGWNNW